ncbi:hypothetical protein FJZ53_05940 [Candidatus Woesearchaeota archaeon]|nr:hypothetical protein [Candidatus Woesearchaeota archaeon]
MKTHKTILAGSFILAGLIGSFGTDFSTVMGRQEAQYSETYQNKKREEIKYFDNGKISGIKKFSDGKLVNERYWNIDGILTVDIDYVYSEKGDTYEQISHTTGTPGRKVKEKQLLKGSPEGKSVILQKWVYDQESFKLITRKHYKEGTSIVEKQDTYDKEERLEKTYVYYYVKGKEELKRVKGFDCYDAQDKKIGLYDEDSKLNIEDIILSRGLSKEQSDELLKVYRSKRTPVAIIDSGFDINHPSLAHKVWKNPKEELNGVDDDKNGWTDDIMGWNKQQNKMIDLDIDSPNINEIIVIHGDGTPLSHGTHVASITLKDLDSFALLGFAGDMTDPAYLNKISHYLKENNILFVNMSFGFGNVEGQMSPRPESFHALEDLIKNNPQTLFFVASGNDYRDIDKGTKSYPPSYDFKNMLVIGALDTDELLESKLSVYKPADFSNIGEESVDIFAPGTDVNGALIGGGNIRKSGTSMASPYALNLGLRIYQENPNLKTSQIKEIMLKTAYVPEKPLPAVSKGIIQPSKALAVAKMLKDNPSIGIEEAVIKIMACQEQ